ncbi:dd42b0c7-84f9-4d38-a1be-94a564dd3467 [Thermothielavioides terrestris]|uniref:Inhibitor I9 domain-containing protein n=2 Tax=Thermothielavioides terrestris TaxID=2587410 RepID=G2RHK3_THETT|nr:uncharacterized protein THITE_2123523 [Thermothielavioides terrestris NRRL 8126]AEO71315.1 hypothetical protein THITE_2123523 [Thermothielavioides terrestris NRRL 8126]SPQ27704.1 dd42b0c7-84f9-4d38-a1be-94a564dd3467 [Thermothielavioides terrestris]
MRVLSFLIAALTLIAGVIAVDIQKSVLITYPPETPDSIVEQAKKAVIAADGIITHEYTLIKGFAAKVGEKVLETISAWGEEYRVLVEEDEEVHAV